MCDYKKIAIAGVINYAIIFLATSLMMFSLGMSGLTFNIVTWLVIALSTYLLASKYYFTKKPKKNEGLMFGLGLGAISVVIEIPLMVYGFSASLGWAWFAQWELWVGYLVMLAVPVLVATQKKK